MPVRGLNPQISAITDLQCIFDKTCIEKQEKALNIKLNFIYSQLAIYELIKVVTAYAVVCVGGVHKFAVRLAREALHAHTLPRVKDIPV